MSDMATMHVDGAARGNPGPAAYSIVLARPGLPVVEEADFIGTATNNVAEYTALVEGLELATQLDVKRLAVFSDSELLVKQMNGEYRVKNPDLLELFQAAKQLATKFEKLTITHVPRAKNARADAIGNDALDGKPRKRGASSEDPTPLTSAAATRGEGRNPAPPSLSGKGVGGSGSSNLSDARVRDDVLTILLSAAQTWASRGLGAVPIEAVWEQLWSVLEDGGVLKKPKKR